MTRDQFIHALELGLGRAILYARDHDVSEFKNVILDACLHCRAYDVPIEGTRASYMLDLLDFVPDKASYFDEVLKSLAGSGDDRDAAHRFHFAARLAVEGNERAKRAMYESYDPGPRMGEHIGIDFLRMDGINGMLFVAEKIGAVMMAQPGRVDEGLLLDTSIEICGEKHTWEALRKAGVGNPRIEAYVATVEYNRNRLDRRSEPSLDVLRGSSYEQLRPRFAEISYGALARWGENASDADLERAALGLLAATGANEQLFHLIVFSRRAFSLGIDALLAFVGVEEKRLGFFALKALSQIAHPEVRELAFRLVGDHARWRNSAILLLARNFQAGDHDIVLDWFAAEDDKEELHQFGRGMRKFCEQHPSDVSEVLMLRALYEKGPCSFCRECGVQRLIELRALTDEMRSECAYDANDEIRELVKG